VSSRRRHTRFSRDWSSDVCSSDLPGELVIVAARPSMGKSVVGLDLVRHAALRCGIGALYVSLEMPRAQVMERLYAAEARVPYQEIGRASCRERAEMSKKRLVRNAM